MPEYPFSDEGLRAALAGFGRRRQKVARTMRKHCIKGDPDSCISCPIAVRLAELFGTEDVVVENTVTVTRDMFEGDDTVGRYYAWTEVISCDTPDAVIDFMASFDARQYPDLIKTHPKEPPA